MNTIEVTIRNTNTRGEVNSLRINGNVPAIVYGGTEKNQKIFLNKKNIKNLIERENFLSNIISLNLDGKTQNVLPKEIVWDPITDEPIHIDFLRIVKDAKIVLEIPVKFINNEKSPGLKKGGVLNIVRRKIELKCPAESIPTELIVDLDETEIGISIKISSIKLPENVVPTIQGRDFVVATVAAPTIVIEPEKPAEETAIEGEITAEASPEGTEKPAEEGKGQDDKAKSQDAKAKDQSKKTTEDKKDDKTKK